MMPINSNTCRDADVRNKLPRNEKQPPNEKLLRRIKSYFRGEQAVRRGICLLNAGAFDQAISAFETAAKHHCSNESLASFLATCMIGKDNADGAADRLGSVERQDESWATVRVRHALALCEAGRQEQAVAALRDSIAADPECAELHFQLGTLLASLERYEEAELRFTQAVNIDREHSEALVNLALCCGVRGAAVESVAHLRRAQARQPRDSRIGLLLAQALSALKHQGQSVHVRAEMPTAEAQNDREGIAELSRLIGSEPDFVDAFLSIPAGRMDEKIFAILLETLYVALERQPEQAELHYHCGRVLARLGRDDAAIDETERAVSINPKFTRALIELGKLYSRTDRTVDAMTRLERAVAEGAEYADVFCMLGNLYRDQGQVARARRAYHRALTLNHRYEEARTALEALPV